MANPATRRVLAIEIRSRKVGYVAFEDNKTLIDWGVRSFARAPGSAGIVAKMLQSLRPALVLLSPAAKQDQHNKESIRRVIRMVRSVAQTLSISTTSINKDLIRAHFLATGHINKYDIARRIAGYFPELAWHTPRRRKPWQGEPAAQVVFDAATVAVFFLDARMLVGKNTFAKEPLWSAPGDE